MYLEILKILSKTPTQDYIDQLATLEALVNGGIKKV